MTKTDNKLLALLGFNATGDLGPWTLYTSARGQIVFYPRVPALNPPSAVQQVMRQRWRIAARQWGSLQPFVRANWQAATMRASLKITGYNLWIHWHRIRDDQMIRTLQHQTGIPLID